MLVRTIGFHGTTRRRADAILAGGFEPSRNGDDWLGDGIYFFEAASTLALAYARKAARSDKASDLDRAAEPVLLRAEIDLSGCIDLFDPIWVKHLKDVADRIHGRLPVGQMAARQHGLALRSFAGTRIVVADYPMLPETFRHNYADCEVLNALYDYLDEVGFQARSVRAPFTFGRQALSNSFLFDQSHVQISVIDASSLINLEML